MRYSLICLLILLPCLVFSFEQSLYQDQQNFDITFLLQANRINFIQTKQDATPPADSTPATPPADAAPASSPADSAPATPPADAASATPPADAPPANPPAQDATTTPPADAAPADNAPSQQPTTQPAASEAKTTDQSPPATQAPTSGTNESIDQLLEKRKQLAKYQQDLENKIKESINTIQEQLEEFKEIITETLNDELKKELNNIQSKMDQQLQQYKASNEMLLASDKQIQPLEKQIQQQLLKNSSLDEDTRIEYLEENLEYFEEKVEQQEELLEELQELQKESNTYQSAFQLIQSTETSKDTKDEQKLALIQKALQQLELYSQLITQNLNFVQENLQISQISIQELSSYVSPEGKSIRSRSNQPSYIKFQAYLLLLFSIILIFHGAFEQYKGDQMQAHNQAKIDFIQQNANTYQPGQQNLNESYNQKLIICTGNCVVTEEIVDPIFNIKIKNSLMLHRKIEMFQWVEQKGIGGKYKYEKKWVDQYIDSSQFFENIGGQGDYQNPAKKWVVQEARLMANSVKVGPFTIPEGLFKQFTIHKQEFVEQKIAEEIRSNSVFNSNFKYIFTKDNYIYCQDEGIEHKVGDVRISFHSYPVSEVSIAAKQDQDSMAVFSFSPDIEQQLDNNEQNSIDCCFQSIKSIDTIYHLEQKILTVDQLTDKLFGDNVIYLIRTYAVVLYLFGFYLIFSSFCRVDIKPFSDTTHSCKSVGIIHSALISVSLLFIIYIIHYFYIRKIVCIIMTISASVLLIVFFLILL